MQASKIPFISSTSPAGAFVPDRSYKGGADCSTRGRGLDRSTRGGEYADRSRRGGDADRSGKGDRSGRGGIEAKIHGFGFCSVTTNNRQAGVVGKQRRRSLLTVANWDHSNSSAATTESNMTSELLDSSKSIMSSSQSDPQQGGGLLPSIKRSPTMKADYASMPVFNDDGSGTISSGSLQTSHCDDEVNSIGIKQTMAHGERLISMPSMTRGSCSPLPLITGICTIKTHQGSRGSNWRQILAGRRSSVLTTNSEIKGGP